MIYNYVDEVQKKVEERLHKESVTEGLFSKQYSFSGVKTITTKNMESVDLTPYDRTLTAGKDGTIGNRFGDIHELSSTLNEYTMKHEVMYNLGWDKGANTDEHEIRTASSVISRQDREIIVPYRDKYRIMRLAEGAGLNKYGLSSAATTGELNRKNIVETLMKARAEMANHFVPMGKQVLLIGETDAIEMKLAEQVIGSDRLSEKPIVNGVVGKIAGFQLRIVPDSYFDWTKINENIDAANAKIQDERLHQTKVTGTLGFLIVTKGCGWSPVKVKTSRVDTAPSNYDGTQILYHEYLDCFVNKTRNVCVYAGWKSAAPGA